MPSPSPSQREGDRFLPPLGEDQGGGLLVIYAICLAGSSCRDLNNFTARSAIKTPKIMDRVVVMLPKDRSDTPTVECPKLQPPAMPAPMPIRNPPAANSAYRLGVSPRTQSVPAILAAINAPGTMLISVMGIQSEPPLCPLPMRVL